MPRVEFATFDSLVRQEPHRFFRWVETGRDELAPAELDAESRRELFGTWFELLRTDAIQNWLLSSRWAARLRDAGDVTLDPVRSLLLRRHLLDLRTRHDASRLLKFWHWATLSMPKIADVWDRARFELAIDPAKRLDEQESAFVEILNAAEETLAKQRLDPAKKWAMDALRRVRDERVLPQPEQPAKQAQVGVVFAWVEKPGQPIPELMRPGFVVRFRLLADSEPSHFLKPAHVFDDSFRRAVESVQSRISLTDLRAMEHDWHWLPDGFLKQASGSLGMWLAQFLAAGYAREDRYTLPAWLVTTATLNPSGSGIGGGAAPVGLLPAKFQALAEEGVRVVLTANPREEVQAAWRQVHAESGVAEHDLTFLDIASELSGSRETHSIVESVASRVMHERWVWPIESLIRPKPAEPTDGPMTIVSQKVALADDQLANWKAQFVPPIYILERLEQARASLREGRGYIELIAPSMWGKSRLSVAQREGWLKAPDLALASRRALAPGHFTSVEKSPGANAHRLAEKQSFAPYGRLGRVGLSDRPRLGGSCG